MNKMWTFSKKCLLVGFYHFNLKTFGKQKITNNNILNNITHSNFHLLNVSWYTQIDLVFYVLVKQQKLISHEKDRLSKRRQTN